MGTGVKTTGTGNDVLDAVTHIADTVDGWNRGVGLDEVDLVVGEHFEGVPLPYRSGELADSLRDVGDPGRAFETGPGFVTVGTIVLHAPFALPEGTVESAGPVIDGWLAEEIKRGLP